MRRALVLLVALALAGTLVADAAARRKATTAESAAIRAVVTAYVAKPGPPAGGRFRRAYVSTVRPAYAMAKLKTGDPVLATAILRRQASGRWKVVSFGAAGFPFNGVPVKVLNDLLGATLCDCY